MPRLTVKVTPNAKRSEILGPVEIAGGETALAIKLKAPPVDGKANQALVAFLAKTFGAPKNAVTIVRGQKNRVKLIEIERVSEKVITRLGRPWETVEKAGDEKLRVVLFAGEAQEGSGVSPATDAQRSQQAKGPQPDGAVFCRLRRSR